MAQVIADRRDVDFVLHEQLQVAQLSQHERYAEFTKKTVDMIVSEARNFAIKEVLPTQKIGDVEGCRLENGAGCRSGELSPALRVVSGRGMAGHVRRPRVGRPGHAQNRGAGGERLPQRRQLRPHDVCGLDPRRRQTDRGFRHPGAEAAFFAQYVFGQVDRHHAADRAGGRLGCRRADHHGGQKRRRHLHDQRQQDFHLQR